VKSFYFRDLGNKVILSDIVLNIAGILSFRERELPDELKII
jgi:hypothetical protein